MMAKEEVEAAVTFPVGTPRDAKIRIVDAWYMKILEIRGVIKGAGTTIPSWLDCVKEETGRFRLVRLCVAGGEHLSRIPSPAFDSSRASTSKRLGGAGIMLPYCTVAGALDYHKRPGETDEQIVYVYATLGFRSKRWMIHSPFNPYHRSP